MYQSITSLVTEEDLLNITNYIEENIIKLDSIDVEVDLSKEYVINHVCIWNSPESIGYKCKIIQKNDKIALVMFKHVPLSIDNMLNSIFRIEDLNI